MSICLACYLSYFMNFLFDDHHHLWKVDREQKKKKKQERKEKKRCFFDIYIPRYSRSPSLSLAHSLAFLSVCDHFISLIVFISSLFSLSLSLSSQDLHLIDQRFSSFFLSFVLLFFQFIISSVYVRVSLDELKPSNQKMFDSLNSTDTSLFSSRIQ